MNVLENIVAVIIVLGVLVTFHEFGHYIVARCCGVKILRFSIGFGKALWRKQAANGTEFVIAAIPLGGYVKMLDERDGAVPLAQRKQAFNQKNIYVRMLIVVAGPFANFLLSIIAYWLIFVIGTTVVVPQIGKIIPDSPAAYAQLPNQVEIVTVQQHPTRSWQEVVLALIDLIGFTGQVEIRVASGQQYYLNVQNFMEKQDPPMPLATLGIEPWQPKIPPIIGRVLPGSPAALAQLKPGEEIVSINQRTVNDWPDLLLILSQLKKTSLELKLREANGNIRKVTLNPRLKEQNDKSQLFIGIAPQVVKWPQQALREIRYSPLPALMQAVEYSWQMGQMTVMATLKMITGTISPHNLSGPVTIARLAGRSARSGVISFVSFLAYLSLSLGIINLLPVPVLDGGHLLYFLIEAIRGKPLSEHVQQQGFKIGLTLVIILMVMAFYFDFLKL